MKKLKLLLLCLLFPFICQAGNLPERDGVVYGTWGYKEFANGRSAQSIGLGIRAWIVGMGVELAVNGRGTLKTFYISGFIPYKWIALHGLIGQSSPSGWLNDLSWGNNPFTIYGVGLQFNISRELMLGWEYRIDKTYNFNVLNFGYRF